MEQISDDDSIKELVLEVIEENMETAKTYDPEKGRMIDFFVGQLMKKTRGKANPAMAVKMFKEELMKVVNNQ